MPHENEADKIAHGTQLRGEKHHQSKLSREQAEEIKRRYLGNQRDNSYASLGKEFGISRTAVYLIVKGKNWK